MTPTVILNLIVSIVAIAGVAALMRAAHLAAHAQVAREDPAVDHAHEQLADPRDAQYELADELERAA